VIFCDDIRQEITGKLLYIGIYTGQMVVGGSLPFVIPPLSAAITLRLPTITTAISPVIKVFQSGRKEPLVTMEAEIGPPNDGTTGITSAIGDLEPETLSLSEMFVVMQIPPFEITEPCVLRVRVFIGDDEIRIGALRVLTGSPND
jgi:hypothetical protein